MKSAHTPALRGTFLLPGLFCLLLVSGCGLTADQKTAVTEFTAATTDFSTLAADEFSRSREDVIEMNGLRLSLGDPSIDRNTALDEHFTVERVKARVDALNALKEYADLLSTLVTSSNQEDIKAASDSFVASLGKVKGVSLTDAQSGAIGKGVAAVGGLLVEHMRLQAMQQVVESAHPAVQQVIDLVERDFSPTADHWSLGYDKVLSALNGQARDVAAHPATRPGIADNASVGQALSLASNNLARRKAITDQVLASVANLRSAEKNLRQVAQSPQVTFEDIKQYASQVQDFVTIYRLVRGTPAK